MATITYEVLLVPDSELKLGDILTNIAIDGFVARRCVIEANNEYYWYRIISTNPYADTKKNVKGHKVIVIRPIVVN